MRMQRILLITLILYLFPCDSTASDIEYQDILPSNYDKIKAPMCNGNATHIYFEMNVIDIDRIDDSKMEFSLHAYLYEQWKDCRLNMSKLNLTNENAIKLPREFLENIWTPPLIFDNTKSGSIFHISIPNIRLELLPSEEFSRCSRYNLIVGCHMKFHFYPLDIQECFLKIALLSHTENEAELHWGNEKSINLTKDIQPLEYYLLTPQTYKTKEKWKSGNFTYIYANFTFVRRLSANLLNVYLPSMLIVSLSWLSFWLDIRAVPARITLGVTSLLTLSTHIVQARKGLPSISYMTAMDIWLFVCLIMVFSSVLEYAIAYHLYFRNKQILETTKVEGSFNESNACSSKKIAISLTRLDYISRYFFPSIFIIFTIIYWAYYLGLQQ